MKKLIVLIIFMLPTMISVAQVNAESPHLVFKGVPIDGKLGEFILKMEKNGFTQVGTEDGMVLLKGDFAAFKNCIVGVATLKQKDLVSKITVIFPESDTWSSLSSDYFTLKELLTEKYGNPSSNEEKFDGSEPNDDNSKMHDVRFDRCKYYTTYETGKGSIMLSIGHVGVKSCFVQLVYRDKINGDIIKAKAKSDL